MHPLTQFLLSGMRSTLRAGLAGSVGVNLGKEYAPFPTHPSENALKTTPRGIEAMFCQHSSTHHFEVEVFGKDHPDLIAELMSRLKVKLTANGVNALMQRSNLGLNLLVVGRAFLLVSQFALQPFQLALQVHKGAGTRYQLSSRYSQELFQSQINADGFSMWQRIRDINLSLQNQLSIPSRCLLHHPHLLDLKSIGNRTMQVNRYRANLGQLDLMLKQRIGFELGKHERGL